MFLFHNWTFTRLSTACLIYYIRFLLCLPFAMTSRICVFVGNNESQASRFVRKCKKQLWRKVFMQKIQSFFQTVTSLLIQSAGSSVIVTSPLEFSRPQSAFLCRSLRFIRAKNCFSFVCLYFRGVFMVREADFGGVFRRVNCHVECMCNLAI